MPSFDSYKVDNLFLLVGKNTLPNYVAAKLLLIEGGTLYLVHTVETKPQATRLKSVLENDSEIQCQAPQFMSLGSYESDAYNIQKKVGEWVKRLDTRKFGMNYTGGTKAMAVHAYRSAFQATQSTGQEAFFSYLDPRRLKMCIDQEEGDSDTIPVLAEDLSISLKTIFKLHDRSCDTEPNQIPLMPELAAILANINCERTKKDAWYQWLSAIFSEGSGDKDRAAKRSRKWKTDNKLKELTFPLTDLPEELMEGFCHKQFVDRDCLSLKLVKESEEFEKLEHFCRWIDGIWLEHYLLQKITLIAEEAGIHNYGMNFKVDLPATESGFEFDVAFTYGYQLFAISCTTSASKSLCKSKLFEAYTRAQQMGGSEARVALLCFVNNKDLGILKAEMGELLSDKQFKIFGSKDLLKIDERIKEWLDENNAELGR